MKLGIIGLPEAGKATVFAALTGARGDSPGQSAGASDPRIATITVLDQRIDYLSDIYQPKKISQARIEYLLPSEIPSLKASKAERALWSQVRNCDALLHVVRNFPALDGAPPESEKDFRQVEEEMILNDLVVVEKRLERLELDRRRGKPPEGKEPERLGACRAILEKGIALRSDPELAEAPELRGFTLLSAKPMLIILNNQDEDETLPEWSTDPTGADRMVVRGRLEEDIAHMHPEEAEEFREAYHIAESALDRVIRRSFELLNRISFFTVGPDEVKAWPIPDGTPALEAAGAIHSDIKRGFIRAEVFHFDDLKEKGSFLECKKAGLVRLEGKDYRVKDGDIITFRFNV